MGILQQVAATMRRLIGRRDNYAGVAGQGAPGGFAGAGVNRLTVSLSTWAGSVNYDLDGGNIGILRARARQLSQSNEHGKRFLTQVATNVVGRKGPMLQVRATVQTPSRDTPPPLDKAANDAVEIHYARWAKRAEITGKMSLAQALRVTAKSCARDGEALIRLVRDRSAAYGLQIQLLEIDRLDDRLNRELPDGDIRQGVERDTAGRPRAYWLLQRHPGENYGKTTAQYERVPATDIIHAFLPERAEQVRGYTWFHAVLLRAAQLHGYNEAAVLAARIGASKVAALERPDDSADLAPTMADGGGDGASTSAPLQMNVEAGEMFELPPGYKLNSWNPDYPHANYESFVRTAMHGLASGLDVAEHNLSGDMTGVNYSSARIAELSEREVWMMLQDWFIDSIVQPIYSEWLAIAMLRGSPAKPCRPTSWPSLPTPAASRAAAGSGPTRPKKSTPTPRVWSLASPAAPASPPSRATTLKTCSTSCGKKRPPCVLQACPPPPTTTPPQRKAPPPAWPIQRPRPHDRHARHCGHFLP